MRSLFLLFTLFVLIGCQKKQSSESAEADEEFEAYGSTTVEEIPGLQFSTQIATKLNYANRPEDDVAYIQRDLDKLYVYNYFTSMDNGNYKYQCNISQGDNQIYVNSLYEFEVNNGRNEVYSWVNVNALQGPGDYTADVYLNGKLIIRKPFRILSEEDENSGNYVLYWKTKEMFQSFGSENPKVNEEWKVNHLRWMESDIRSVNVAVHNGFNRYFVVTGSGSNYSLHELQKSGSFKTIRSFSGVSDLEQMYFQQSHQGDLFILYNQAGFNTAIDLKSGEWSEPEYVPDLPEANTFPSPDGRQLVKKSCEGGVVLVQGANQMRIKDLQCDASIGWANWDADGIEFYFDDVGNGIFAYNTQTETLRQILYSPFAIHPVYFENQGMDFIGYAEDEKFIVATNNNPNGYFVEETNSEYSFRRILRDVRPANAEIAIDYYDEPELRLDHGASMEAEYFSKQLYAVGTVIEGDYDGGELLRYHERVDYDKMGPELYESQEPHYLIRKDDQLIFLGNHISLNIKNNNLSLYDPGFALKRSNVFSTASEFLIDRVTRVDELEIEREISIDGNRFNLEAILASYDFTDFDPLLHDRMWYKFYTLKEDDGSVNLLRPDGTRAVYGLSFNEVIIEPSSIKFEDYRIYSNQDCQGSRTDVASIHELDESELQSIGTLNEEPIYSFTNQNHPKLRSAYDQYKVGLEESGVMEYDDNITLKSYDEFLQTTPIFFRRDLFGRFVRFIHKDLLPPANCEPILYLYPEDEQEISVTLGESIDVLASYPFYQSGWKMMVRPDGQLIDAKTGARDHRVFWEGVSMNLPRLEKGHVVSKTDVDEFMNEKLSELGLVEKEIEEFKEAWLPELTSQPYCFIGFYDQTVIDKYAPIELDPTPETMIRVLMDFEPLDEFKLVPAPTKNPTPKRIGFTVVEWGGLKR